MVVWNLIKVRASNRIRKCHLRKPWARNLDEVSGSRLSVLGVLLTAVPVRYGRMQDWTLLQQ